MRVCFSSFAPVVTEQWIQDTRVFQLKCKHSLGLMETRPNAVTGGVDGNRHIFRLKAQSFTTFDLHTQSSLPGPRRHYWQVLCRVSKFMSYMTCTCMPRNRTLLKQSTSETEAGERVDSDYFSRHIPSPAPEIMNQPVMSGALCVPLNRYHRSKQAHQLYSCHLAPRATL